VATADMNEHDLLDHNLTNHKPADDLLVMKMERLRADAKGLGHSILAHAPDCRERSLALTNLEQACMWAIAAMARNQ
jgi:hypothetical protein